jgi:hypothetical protein
LGYAVARTSNIASFDARFWLTIFSVDITDSDGLNLAGDGVTAGTDYISPADTAGGGPNQLRLFRLFGDSNGDGVVDQTDLAAFRGSDNTSIGNGEYLYYFDSDNSGTIDTVDLGQFRTRFNTNIFAP